MHTIEMHVCVLQLRRQTGQTMSPAEELQHKLKLCKSFTVDQGDSTFLLKLMESSTVHLLRLYEREMICPRVDSTVLILSC